MWRVETALRLLQDVQVVCTILIISLVLHLTLRCLPTRSEEGIIGSTSARGLAEMLESGLEYLPRLSI
jgi:hypothetical protein